MTASCHAGMRAHRRHPFGRVWRPSRSTRTGATVPRLSGSRHLSSIRYTPHMLHRRRTGCVLRSLPRKSKHAHTWPPPRARVDTVQNRPDVHDWASTWPRHKFCRGTIAVKPTNKAERSAAESVMTGALHGCCSLVCVSALNLRQYSSNDISVRARALTRSKPLSMPSDV